MNLNNLAQEKIKNLEENLQYKINEVNEYENKFTYFNDYISFIKNSLMKFQELLFKYISMYNKLSNEDLNSLLSKTF